MVTAGATKQALRKSLLRRLYAQGEKERKRKSQLIWQKLARLTAFRRAAVVCSYVALPYEVQTWRMIVEMLAKGKRVVVPAAMKKTRDLALFEIQDPERELAKGAHSVMEPIASVCHAVAPEELDLVLVPGLAFDAQGYRLGHGQGYYDRFLSRVPHTVPTIGLAYDFQFISRLPTAAHDHAVRRVVTN